MEAEGQIAETLCEVAEELPWRKLLNRGRGVVDATQTSELDVETRRAELVGKSVGQEKPSASPAAGGSWTENVGNRPVSLEVLTPAA